MTKTRHLLRELRSSLWVKPSLVELADVLWVTAACMGACLLAQEILTSAARRHSALALEQAERSLATTSHKEIIRKLAQAVGS